MPVKNPQRLAPRKGSKARSRVLHEAGFRTLADAAVCSEAVMADLETGKIDAAEANYINAAVGHWRRTHIRKGGR